MKVLLSPKIHKYRTYFFALGLTVAVFIVFSNSLGNDFTNWDDDDYVTRNGYIKDLSLSGLKNIFTVYVSSHYHPLTLLSLACDYHIWGYNPGGYIWSNILLHILSSIVLMLLLYKLTHNLVASFLLSLLFAIHPMRVESVVWISERKDVLYVFFYLLALWCYQQFCVGENKKKNYLLTLLFFFVSLLAKASAVTLPLMLLLFDYFNKRRFNIKTAIFEKIPFFILSLIFGLVAIDAQSMESPNIYPFYVHVFLATYALSFYLFKFLAPFYQSAIIPFPEIAAGILPLKYYLSILIIPLLIFIPVYYKKYQRVVVFGILFFMIPLWPILIKFPIGPAFLAERYTYVPHIGLAFITAYFYAAYTRKRNLKHDFKNKFFIVLLLFFVFFAIKTVHRNKVWVNNFTLFSDVVAKNHKVPVAHLNLGNIEFERGHYSNAIPHYTNAINISTNFKRAYLARGLSYYYKTNFERAIEDFSKVLDIDKENTLVMEKRAQSYLNINEPYKAKKDYSWLMEREPQNSSLYNKRGIAYMDMNNNTMALADFNKALALDSTYAVAHFNKALLYEKNEEIEKALLHYTKAVDLAPDMYQAYNARGVLRGQYYEDYEGGYEDFKKALSVNPQMHEALGNMVFINTLLADTAEACRYLLELERLGVNMTSHPLAPYCENK